MEEVRKKALEYYNNGSTQLKESAIELFNLMDSNGDSSINVAEFTLFIKGNRLLSRTLIPEDLFTKIDKDGNGRLDFNEFITFFYMILNSCRCDCCGCMLMCQRHVTCAICFASGSNTFDLCSGCFSSKIFAHQHAEFVDFATPVVMENKPVASQYKASSVKQKTRSSVQAEEAVKKYRKRDLALQVAINGAALACNIM